MTDTATDSEARIETCILHPDAPAFARCVPCGRGVCGQCLSRDPDGLVQCVQCAAGVDIDVVLAAREVEATPPESPSMAHPGPLSVADVVAWEAPRTTSDALAFWRTTIEGLSSPNRYMARIPWVRGDLRNPMMYGLLAGCVGQAALILQLAADPDAIEIPGVMLSSGAVTGLLLLSLCLMPLVLVFALFVKSWIAHRLLRFLETQERPFEATFRVFCYAEASAVLLLIPVAGPYAEKFFAVFLLLTGLRHAQGAGLWTSFVALAPVLLIATLIR